MQGYDACLVNLQSAILAYLLLQGFDAFVEGSFLCLGGIELLGEVESIRAVVLQVLVNQGSRDAGISRERAVDACLQQGLHLTDSVDASFGILECVLCQSQAVLECGGVHPTLVGTQVVGRDSVLLHNNATAEGYLQALLVDVRRETFNHHGVVTGLQRQLYFLRQFGTVGKDRNMFNLCRVRCG